MKLEKWGSLLLLVILAVTSPVLAQKFTSTIQGTVTDPSGAVVAGAQVTAISLATSESRSATTNSEGGYVITDLQPGMYDVKVKHQNFRESIIRGVELHVSTQQAVNFALEVGSVTEQVTVEANAVQVETSTGAVTNVVDGTQVRELPLNGRSFVQLTQLMPGVSPQSNFDSKHKGLEAGVDFSVNGNNTTGNLFLVDGVNNNDIGSNRTILVYPSIDAIQEFKVLRNSYGPEYGQAMGAIINIVTRGGTNQFHGGGFYFGRNDKLNATDYFNNLNGVPKDVLRRNDYGYNIGGPILKDKLFFFWSQEWNREIRGKVRRANVPTVAEKAGDFSALRVASDGSACENVPTDPTDSSVAFTSVDQAQALHPGTGVSNTGTLIAQLFPDPNVAQGAVIPGDCNNWAQSLSAPIYWREENARGDYKISKTWSLMGRWTRDTWSQPFPSTLGFWGDDKYPSVESSWEQPGRQATVKLTKLFGDSAVNDFQISYAANVINITRTGLNPGLNDQINAAYTPFFGYNAKFQGNQIAYPIFWGGLGNGADSDSLWQQGPWQNNEELYILKDDFSKVKGTHTFKLGFLITNNKKNELVNGSDGEAPNYNGPCCSSGAGIPTLAQSTGNGTFDALWGGRMWSFSELENNPYTVTRWHDVEFYYGDTWKIRRNITLEYGARWSFLRQPFSANNKIASWQPELYDPGLGDDPCNGLLVVPGTSFCQDRGFSPGTVGLNRSLKANDNHAIAPRVGIAWDPRGDGKMSVRAGVGQFYQRERLTNYLQVANNTPFALSASGDRTLDETPAAGSLDAGGSPSFGLDPRSNLPNTWQWNLTVERELFRDTKLELGYVANRGIHLLRYTDANAVPAASRLGFALDNTNDFRFAPVFGTINYGNWTANSNYHSLQALFRTRVKSLDAQFAYTWSKSLADTDISNSGTSGQLSTLADPFNPHMDYGPTPINRPHIFVGNIVYNAPSFVGQNSIVRNVLGGWELASILSYASGPSITVFSGGTIEGAPGGWAGTGTGQNSSRPNVVAGQSCYASGGLKHQWLNPGKWDLDNYQLGTFGNSSVGICGGPGLANTDFSLYKNFKVKEKVTLQFRFEFYNIFNKTQFRADSFGDDTSLASGGTACSTTTAGNGDINSINNPTSACFGRTLNTVAWVRDTDQRQTFGLLSNDRGPREIQYALKITF